MPQPANPQDFNRYSYVRNNPVNLIDPSGHWVFFVVDSVLCVAAALGVGWVGGRAAFEGGTAAFSPTLDRARRDTVGGALVTGLADTITSQASAHGINADTLASIIRHEGAAVERRGLTLWPGNTPGGLANVGEYVQAGIRGLGGDHYASVGIMQMQVRRGLELEEMGYVSAKGGWNGTVSALLTEESAVEYGAAMLHYLQDQLGTVSGFNQLSLENQHRILSIGYNQGWEYLSTNIENLTLLGVIAEYPYDDQTLSEYYRWRRNR